MRKSAFVFLFLFVIFQLSFADADSINAAIRSAKSLIFS